VKIVVHGRWIFIEERRAFITSNISFLPLKIFAIFLNRNYFSEIRFDADDFSTFIFSFCATIASGKRGAW
jgi:hypothetical protein